MTEQQLSLEELAPRKRPIADVHGLSRLGDPDTSKAAAASISGRTERLILAAMNAYDFSATRPGWTADELCDRLPTVYPPTLVSALSRLKGHALICDSGERRPSRRGMNQIVWVLT